MEEFYAVLDAIQAAGYTPLDMGTNDQWEAATMGYQNIGPNYWKGEDGRLGSISGDAKFTDPEHVAVFEQLAQWAPYLPSGFQAQTYPDSQNLFTLGQAAIYPTGSWEISLFNDQADFAMGAFPAPGGKCRRHLLHQRPHRYRHRHEHCDRSSRRGEDLLELGGDCRICRTVQQCLYLASSHWPMLTSRWKIRWRKSFWIGADSANRPFAIPTRFLSRGEPNLENELWRVSAQVVNGDITPEEATQQLQAGLDAGIHRPAGAI